MSNPERSDAEQPGFVERKLPERVTARLGAEGRTLGPQTLGQPFGGAGRFICRPPLLVSRGRRAGRRGVRGRNDARLHFSHWGQGLWPEAIPLADRRPCPIDWSARREAAKAPSQARLGRVTVLLRVGRPG